MAPTHAPTAGVLDWVARQVHPRGRVTAVDPLPGGLTAHIDRLRVDSPDGNREVVLRRWPDDEWADGLVVREADALAAVRGQGVPAPQLLAADGDGSQSGVRCTLTSALPGQPDLTPSDLQSWLEQLAVTQASIHRVPAHPPTRWYGWYDEEGPRSLDWLTDRGLREAARQVAEGPLDDEEVLVHGDYQHFNVLWSDGRLSGVVDWPNAATGNRGSDVGHCRKNLAVLFDATVAADYLVTYERAAGVHVDRRADLRALLCYHPDMQQSIPHQVAGRAQVDIPGIPDRLAATVKDALDGLD